MASEVLINISKDEVERFRMLSELKYELDTQSNLAYAKSEGREEGLKIGLEEVARKALAEGASMEFIQKITGLDIEAIKKLA